MFLPVALKKTPAAGTGIKHIILVTMKDRGATCQESFVVRQGFPPPSAPEGSAAAQADFALPLSVSVRRTIRINILFFDPRVKCKTASGRGAPFCALPGKRKNNTKKFAPRLSRNAGRKRRALRKTDAGSFPLFRPRSCDAPTRRGRPALRQSGPGSSCCGRSLFQTHLAGNALAARRPAPMARMTVAAPVTMSPPAYTLGMRFRRSHPRRCSRGP